MGKRDKKREKKSCSLTFHPAVPLLVAADRELAFIRLLALQKYGIDFAGFSRREGMFFAEAEFDANLDPCSLELFAELVEGHVPDIEFGLTLTYYIIDGESDWACMLTFSRRHSEAEWSLKAMPNTNDPKDIRKSLRRLKASIAKPRILKREDAVLRQVDNILKEYHESVLIPRKARPI